MGFGVLGMGLPLVYYDLNKSLPKDRPPFWSLLFFLLHLSLPYILDVGIPKVFTYTLTHGLAAIERLPLSL